MSTFGISEINNFLEKLHSKEYMIHDRAEKIPYENGNMAQVLRDSLKEFETLFRFMPIPHVSVTDRAYNAITAAHTHDVVIDKNDLRKKLRETEELLKRCDEDKVRLEEEVKNLHQELLSCQNVKAGLEDLLSRYTSQEGEVT